MKCYALVTPGIEQVAQREIQELISVVGTLSPLFIEFDAATTEDILTLLSRSQSIRRILLALGEGNDVETMSFFPIIKDIFISDARCKIDVEHVKGQENRLLLAKKFGKNLCTHLAQSCNIFPSFDLKHPTHHIFVVRINEKYVVGVDLAGKELNCREYRVFPHAASWKGDVAYYFLRQSAFDPAKKSLFFFVKDGALPIEAALYVMKRPVRNIYDAFLWKNIPLFQGMNARELPYDLALSIFAGDESMQNILAARKNAKLAGVDKHVQVMKCSLDELDVKFSAGELEYASFFVTTKDEERINELYYQASYILKSAGVLFLITRRGLELSAPSQFALVEREEFHKGDSIYAIWLMRKK